MTYSELFVDGLKDREGLMKQESVSLNHPISGIETDIINKYRKNELIISSDRGIGIYPNKWFFKKVKYLWVVIYRNANEYFSLLPKTCLNYKFLLIFKSRIEN